MDETAAIERSTRDAAAPQRPNRVGSPYVIEAVEEFLRTKATREKKTLASYSGVLLGSERGTKKPLGQPFAVSFHNRKFASLNHDEVTAWFVQRVDGGAQDTKHRISKAARHFLEWTFKRGYTKHDLASAIEVFRQSQGRIDWLTWDDVHRLISAIPEPRYRFATQWLFFTGARVGEAISAKQRDVRWRPEFDTYEWTIPNSKTHSARNVLLPDELATALNATRDLNSPHPDWPVLWDCEGRGFGRVENPAAPISERTINRALERARNAVSLTTPVTAHVARHSYCSNWVNHHGRDDFSVEKLSLQVGTSTQVLRRTYVHFDLRPEDWAAIKSFGSRSPQQRG